MFLLGKGGVGRSTVAQALGLLAARRGRRAIVVEVSGRGDVPRLFGRDCPDGVETELLPGLWTLTVDPRRALEEYLGDQLPGRLIAEMIGASGAAGYVAAATPGLRELLTVGKIWELAQDQRRPAGTQPYDVVIVDAPATGHGLALLEAPRTFVSAAQIGPIARQGAIIDATLRDRAQTALVAVATPEQAAVDELLELRSALGGELDAVLANGVAANRFSAADATALRAADARAPSRRRRCARRSASRSPRGARAAASSAPARTPAGADRAAAARRRRALGGRARGPRRAAGGRGMSGLPAELDGRLCICLGAGGVGKTTMAASIALGRAGRGERVAVITIDPAPRLARALGFEELAGEPQLVKGAGELWAMRLDPKRTLDELIATLAPDVGTLERALSNRIYRELSAAVAGSQEFSAVAKLYELNRSGAFDAIVLDTPPSRNALDFLDAPARLVRFFEGRAIRLLLAQGGFATRLAGRAGSPLLAILSRLTGGEVLREITAFFVAIGGMIDGLAARAAAVQALLHEPDTTFVLVSSPRREALEEAIAFAAELGRAELTVAALVVNRVHTGRGRRRPPPGRARARCSARASRAWCATASPTLDALRRPPTAAALARLRAAFPSARAASPSPSSPARSTTSPACGGSPGTSATASRRAARRRPRRRSSRLAAERVELAAARRGDARAGRGPRRLGSGSPCSHSSESASSTRSLCRWPQITSRSSARRCSSISRRAPGSERASRDGIDAGDQRLLERDRARDPLGDGAALVGLGAQRVDAARRGGRCAGLRARAARAAPAGCRSGR